MSCGPCGFLVVGSLYVICRVIVDCEKIKKYYWIDKCLIWLITDEAFLYLGKSEQ